MRTRSRYGMRAPLAVVGDGERSGSARCPGCGGVWPLARVPAGTSLVRLPCEQVCGVVARLAVAA